MHAMTLPRHPSHTATVEARKSSESTMAFSAFSASSGKIAPRLFKTNPAVGPPLAPNVNVRCSNTDFSNTW
jgi:hypothetical protein